MTFTPKGWRMIGVLKFVTFLRILLFLHNRSIIPFLGWGGVVRHKICHFFVDIINVLPKEIKIQIQNHKKVVMTAQYPSKSVTSNRCQTLGKPTDSWIWYKNNFIMGRYFQRLWKVLRIINCLNVIAWQW